MHQLALIAAMTAAGGLFSAPRSSCPGGQCPSAVQYAAPAPVVAQPQPVTYSAGYVAPGYAAPVYQAPTYQAPAAYTAAPRVSYYYPPASYTRPAATCTTGTCPRR